MRLPVKSETDAFRIAYGLSFLVGASLLLGAAVGPVWGIALFTLGALAALVWETRTEDPDRLTDLRAAAESARAAPPGRRRILVVADEALHGSALREELLARGEPRPELCVVAPVLLSRSHFMVTDVDREREEAHARLEATLAWARQQGFEAHGKIGDHVDRLAAIADELRMFGADEVIVATHPPERANWLEAGILEHLRKEVDIPLTHVVLDTEREPATT